MHSSVDTIQQLYTHAFIRMALANLFTVSSFSMFFLFPLFVTTHGGSEADIGVIMGASSLSSVLCRPWISEMIDRVGRKRSYTIGCLIMTLLPTTYVFFQGDLKDFYVPLLLVRIVHGAGLAICFTSVFTYVADIVPSQRLNEGIGMFGVTGLTGLALGPVLAEAFIKKLGFQSFFFAASGMASLGLLLHLSLQESYIRTKCRSSTSFVSVLLKKRILMVALLAVIFGFGLAASGGFVSPYAKEKEAPFISMYFISYSLSAVITRVVGGRLADRIGEERIIPYALLLTAGGLLTLSLLGGTWVLVLSGLMSGCGQGLLFPCINSLAVRSEPVDIRGKVTGAFTGGIDTGVLVGSIALGYIGEWAGFALLFLVAGVVLLSGLGICRIRLAADCGPEDPTECGL